MSFSQAFKGGHLTKPEIFSANALGAVHNCWAIDARQGLAHPFPLYEMDSNEKGSRRSSQLTLGNVDHFAADRTSDRGEAARV